MWDEDAIDIWADKIDRLRYEALEKQIDNTARTHIGFQPTKGEIGNGSYPRNYSRHSG